MPTKEISSSQKAATKGRNALMRIGMWFQRNWLRFKRWMVNYLKSKAKNFPTIPPKPRRKVVEEIIRNPVFIKATEQFVRETGFSTDEVQEKAREYVKEIASDLNYLSFPLWDVVLTWVFNKLYDGLLIDEESLEKIKAHVGKAPIVFVPNHRSHMDYLLLSYVFYYRQLPMLYICAGKNMNFWPLGTLFRKSGAFFIRRSFEGNRLYQAALYSYLHYLLKEKALLEFFIEGTRSRTGKLLSPKLGILSLLVKAFQEQEDIKDVVFVPTSVVYESVIEERTYESESQGGTKKNESIWDVFRIRKYLRGRYGKVYIRFAEPISVKELPAAPGEGESDLFVPRLANKIGYAINRHTVVTPTSLVAMSILTHANPVITRDEIERRSNRFLDYLKYKNAPVSDLIIKHPKETMGAAIEQFVDSRVLKEHEDDDGIFYRLPHSRRRNLEFYKNTGVHFFTSAAAVANILNAEESALVSQQNIESDIVFLRDLFSDEFRFSSRKSLHEHINAILDFFTQQGIIHQEETDYRVNPDKHLLQEYAALIDSTLSFYWGLFKVIANLPEESFSEADIVNRLQDRIRLLLMRHFIMRQEAISTFSVRNALQTCVPLWFSCNGKGNLGSSRSSPL